LSSPVPKIPQNRSCHEQRRSPRGNVIIRDGTLREYAPEIEVFSTASNRIPPFQWLRENSPKLRRQQVQRVSAERDHFWASRHRGRCSAQPAQPSKTTEKYGRSRVGRNFSQRQVAEGMGLRPNLLHFLSLISISYFSHPEQIGPKTVLLPYSTSTRL